MLVIVASAILALGAAMLGATMVVDRPRSVFYDDIEPLFEGIAGVERMDPRGLVSCHYRVTTLHKEVVKVERMGPWEIERGIAGWKTLILHRTDSGLVERIEVFAGDEQLLATEEIRREGQTVFVTSGGGVEERDLDDDGRIRLIRQRGADGTLEGAAAIVRDPQGRIIQRRQHTGDGKVSSDSHYEYGDSRYPTRVTSETSTNGACPVRTTRFDEAGRREEVSCLDEAGAPRVDPASGCEVSRYRYSPGERTLLCTVGDQATPGEPVRY